MLCCVDVSARNAVTRRAQDVRRDTRRAMCLLVLCMEGARCVGAYRWRGSCERGVWTCGACAFMCARMRDVIPL